MRYVDNVSDLLNVHPSCVVIRGVHGLVLAHSPRRERCGEEADRLSDLDFSSRRYRQVSPSLILSRGAYDRHNEMIQK